MHTCGWLIRMCPTASPVISSQLSSMVPPEPLSVDMVQLAGSATPVPMSAMVKGGGDTAWTDTARSRSAAAAAAGNLAMLSERRAASRRVLRGDLRDLRAVGGARRPL